jgi:protein involved in polysaccharide export with SLBB domain
MKFLGLIVVTITFAACGGPLKAQDILSTPTQETDFSRFLQEQKTAARTLPPRQSVPLESAIDPSSYILGPHDEVTIGIWGQISQTMPLDISPEGNIIFSPAGPIDIQGLTVMEAQDRVREALSGYYPGVKITLTLTGIRQMKVHISGEVYYPGSYEVTPVDRLFDIIQQAGGFLPGGSVRNISIERPSTGETKSIDLERFLQDGVLDENPMLREGDVIYIPPKTNMILVRGEVNGRVSPGQLQQRIPPIPEGEVRGAKTEIFLEYRNGDSLSQAIKRAGGLLETADLNAAHIRRQRTDSTESVIPVDLYSLFVMGDPSADVPLKKGDIIEIPRADREVYVTGIVASPGPYPYRPGLTAYEYIGMAGGPTIQGSARGWKVIDVRGRKRKIKPSDTLRPGETVMVPERFITKMGKILTPISAASTIIISIVAVQRR